MNKKVFWRKYEIKEIASKNDYSTQIGPFGLLLKASEYVDQGIPILRGINVNNGRFYDKEFAFISEKKASMLDKFHAFSEDIILAHKGTLGEIGIIPKNSNFKFYVLGNSMMKISCNKELVNPKYLYYWLCGPIALKYIFNNISQTGVPQILQPLTTLRKMNVLLPNLNYQNKVASFLDLIDNLIEKKENYNFNLENFAFKIFKLIFIHGKSFKNILKNKVNIESWNFKKLGDFVKFIRGVSYKTLDLEPSKTVLVTLKSINREGGFRFSGFKEYVGKYKEEQIVKDNDIIIAQTDLTQKAEVLGRVALVREVPDYNKYIISLDICKILPSKELPRFFLYNLLKTDNFIQHCKKYANGTTVLHMAGNAIPNFQFRLPPFEIILKFEDYIYSLYNLIKINDIDIQYLTKLKAKLLPYLLNGSIQVK